MSHSVDTPVPNPMLNDVWYARLEYIARVVLPGLATLYLALSTLWKLPAGPEVVGTIVAVDTFLGVFIGYAQKSYDNSEAAFNGSIVVGTDPESGNTRLSSMVIDKDPSEYDKLVLKVNSEPDIPAAS